MGWGDNADDGRDALRAAHTALRREVRGIPPALLEAPWLDKKEIWVLQPRRIAAEMAALRVASEMGEEAGQQVGYHFRFEKKIGPLTQLKFMTDGMLFPLSQTDSSLSHVGLVILDEFHERSQSLDLGLGLAQNYGGFPGDPI